MLKKKIRRRIGLIVGAVAAAALLIFCQSRIWRIEISGCGFELANAVRYSLAEYGVKKGSAKRGLDIKELQRQLMLEDERIAWIAVNIVGSTAFVEVSERKSPPEQLDPKDKIANIAASCDGVIKYLEIYEGQAMVKVGEAVSRGDIIVSGIMEDQYGKKQLKYARAKVIARVSEQSRVEVPLRQQRWQPAGEEKKRWFLKLGERLLPLGFGAPEGMNSVASQQRELPFGALIERSYTPQRLESITLTAQQAKEEAMRLLDAASKPFPDERIISRSRKAEIINGVCIASETRVVERDIAETREVQWERGR